MNTFEELIENGLSQHNANRIIEECNKRIGTINGVYLIKDITYDFKSKGKVVTLECMKCGAEIQRTMISGRNKWSELIKTCQWVDMVVQANNKRPPEEWKIRGKKYEFKGKEYTISELRDKFKVNDMTIRYRMKVKGMTLEEALKTPKITMGRPRKEVV